MLSANAGLGRPPSASRYSTDRDTFEFSMQSRSAMNRLPTPNKARFLTSSLPKAPAPITNTLARASRDWSHQPIATPG
jgi:hypothetical protein